MSILSVWWKGIKLYKKERLEITGTDPLVLIFWYCVPIDTPSTDTESAGTATGTFITCSGLIILQMIVLLFPGVIIYHDIRDHHLCSDLRTVMQCVIHFTFHFSYKFI
jgi:hypothetical protein